MRIGHALLQLLMGFVIFSCNAGSSQTASAGGGGAPVANRMVPMDAIVITDTGSTNMTGYKIIVGRNGEASYASGEGRGSAQLPASTFSKLKYDVVMAQPLSHVRASPDCMKSASFGDSMFVALGGEKSEDLACPAGAKGEALKDDIEAVAQFLHVRNVPRGRGQSLPPQNY